MLKQRRFILTIVLAVLLFPLPLSAQDKPDTVYTFRFVPQKDMFRGTATTRSWHGSKRAWSG